MNKIYCDLCEKEIPLVRTQFSIKRQEKGTMQIEVKVVNYGEHLCPDCMIRIIEQDTVK